MTSIRSICVYCGSSSRVRKEYFDATRATAYALTSMGLGLVYGGFSYTKETHEAKLGSIELSMKERETVNVPVWAGVGAIAIGGMLLLLGGRKS